MHMMLPSTFFEIIIYIDHFVMPSFHWKVFGLHRKIRKHQVRDYISVSLLGQIKTVTIL